MDASKEISEVSEPTVHLEKSSSRTSFDSITRKAIGGSTGDDLPPRYFRSARFIGTFAAFILSYQAGFLGYVMIANVLTIINTDIGPSPDIVWVLLVYTLCQTIIFTIVGRLSDIFGRRYYFITGNALAFIGYLVSGRAKNVNVLIGASVISGIGSGIQISGSTLSGELVPNRYRMMSYGIIAASLAPMSSIAPGLARTLCVHTAQGWRSIYYLVASISFFALVLQILFYFPPPFNLLHENRSKTETLKRLDYGGLIIFSGSAASILLGISWGGQSFPWRSYQVITTICVGGAGLIAFFVYEKYSRVHYPLMPLYLFTNRNYVALGTCASVGSMIFFALNVVWPQQIAIIYQASPTTTGWISSTLTAGAILGQMIGAILPRVLGKVKWQLVAICCIFTAFIGGMAGANRDTKGMAIAFSLISSTMIGYMECICLAGGPLMMESKDLGLASGVQFSVRTGFSSLAVSIYVTILSNKLTVNIPKYIIPAALKSGLPQSSLPPLMQAIGTGNSTAMQMVAGITPVILQAVGEAQLIAYQKSFQVIYLASIAFGVCAIIAALSVSSSKLDERLTAAVARKLQGVGGEEVQEKVNTLE